MATNTREQTKVIKSQSHIISPKKRNRLTEASPWHQQRLVLSALTLPPRPRFTACDHFAFGPPLDVLPSKKDDPRSPPPLPKRIRRPPRRARSKPKANRQSSLQPRRALRPARRCTNSTQSVMDRFTTSVRERTRSALVSTCAS